jgi:hypothetical protein
LCLKWWTTSGREARWGGTGSCRRGGVTRTVADDVEPVARPLRVEWRRPQGPMLSGGGSDWSRRRREAATISFPEQVRAHDLQKARAERKKKKAAKIWRPAGLIGSGLVLSYFFLFLSIIEAH